MSRPEKVPRLQRLPKVTCINQTLVQQIRKGVNEVSHAMSGQFFTNMKTNILWEPAAEVIDGTQSFGKERLEDLKIRAESQIAGLACEQTIQINGETIKCSGLEHDGESLPPLCPLKEAVSSERLIRRANKRNRQS